MIEVRSTDQRDRPTPAGVNSADAVENARVEALLERMRASDRQAAADFIIEYGPRIRRRIRGKLNPSMRRIFDSQEILSTLGRRLDQFVQNGKIEATTHKQLWALVYRMANHAVIDKARVFRRLQRVEREDGPFAQEFLGRLRQAERAQTEGFEIEIDRALSLFEDRIDRQILTLWLEGNPHRDIAQLVDKTPEAVRKRWQKISAALRDRLGREPLD